MAVSGAAWEPVQRSRTHELVMSQIESQLLSGRLKPGDTLHLKPRLDQVHLFDAGTGNRL